MVGTENQVFENRGFMPMRFRNRVAAQKDVKNEERSG
jgi:hypothetical protein